MHPVPSAPLRSARVTTLLCAVGCASLALSLGGRLGTSVQAVGVGPVIPPDQVAVPIGALPFTIGAPGLYRVTGDLTGAAGQDGIRIEAEHVVLDLGGYTLTGADGTSSGVRQVSGFRNATIANGTVTNWSVGVDTWSACTVRNVQAVSNTTDGFFGSLSSFTQCLAADNGGRGFDLFTRSRADECSARGNGQGGLVVSDRSSATECFASSQSGPAFLVRLGSIVRDCQTTGASTQTGFLLEESRAVGCRAQSYAVGFGLANRSELVGCRAEEAIDCGIRAAGGDRIESCTVVGVPGEASGDGIEAGPGTVVRECRVEDLMGHAIVATGPRVRVESCQVFALGGDGIVVAGDGRVTDNLVADCAGTGLRTTGDSNRLEANSVRDCGTAVDVTGVDNLVIRNDEAGNGTSYLFDPNNTRGQLVGDQNWILNKSPWLNFRLDF